MLQDLPQLLMSGVALGGVYTLLAMGLFLTFATSRALHFGQGDLLALAAFLGMAGITKGIPVALVVLLVAIAMPLLGMLVERVAVRPIVARARPGDSHLGWILTTVGVGMIMQNGISTVWGKSRNYSPPLFSGGDRQLVPFMGARVNLEEIAIGVASLALVATMYLVLYRSTWGKRVAAVAFDPQTAQLLGIDVRRTVVASYAAMALLTGCAGVLVGPLVPIEAHMGMLFLLMAFAVVSLGGFTNPLGLLIGGFTIGVVGSLGTYLDSKFGDLYPFVLVLACLAVRPQGIFGERKTDVR